MLQESGKGRLMIFAASPSIPSLLGTLAYRGELVAGLCQRVKGSVLFIGWGMFTTILTEIIRGDGYGKQGPALSP